MKVTNSSIPSGEASHDTKRRRSQELLRIREKLSIGDSEQQMVDEVKMLPREMREDLIKDMKFTVHVPPEQSLAMKADLCLPWKKLRIMRRYIYICASTGIIQNAMYRWMKAWNIDVASERKQREIMKEDLLEIQIRGEAVPFSFSTKCGIQEIQPAPFACVVDLNSVVFHLLDEKER